MKAIRGVARLKEELRAVQARIPDLEVQSQGYDEESALAGIELAVAEVKVAALSSELNSLLKARAAKADRLRSIRLSIPSATLQRLDAMAERVGVDRRALIQMAVFQAVGADMKALLQAKP